MSGRRAYAIGPKEPPLLEMTIGDALRKSAEHSPGQTALISGAEHPANRTALSYAELLSEATQVAKALLTSYSPGERIAVWSQNRPEWVILEFGAALAGLTLVTLNPSYQRDEVVYILNQSGSVGMFVSNEHRGNKLLEIAQSAQPHCANLRRVISFDDWDDFLQTAEAHQCLPEVTPSDIAMLQYTSGTTGAPKGAGPASSWPLEQRVPNLRSDGRFRWMHMAHNNATVSHCRLRHVRSGQCHAPCSTSDR